MGLSMKNLVTFFITVLSCTMASLQAMEALSLQQIGLQKQLALWEQKLHNAQSTAERANIYVQVKDFFETRPALEELSQKNIPQEIAEPTNNGKAWVGEITHDHYELQLKLGSSRRIFRTYAPVSRPVSWSSTESLSLSPDNRYLAIAILTPQENTAPRYRIDILEVTQNRLIPVGNIPLTAAFASCCHTITWNEQGIIIGNSQQRAVCKSPLLAASKNTIDELEWTEVLGLKKFAHQTWSVLKTPCTVAAISVMTLAIAASLTMITHGVERLHTYPLPIGN